ncbi:transcription factor bHLH68 [Malania oleifera]|uniref:transcription factor bHLH68 n=1 Tax=Malania oleifera TaxID=397392 RepID=UPI0025AE5636|nr:transcription factor bHLH68 [Malania oleifera]
MNRGGVLQKSPVQQMVAAGGPGGWWSINTAMRPGALPQQPSPFLTTSPASNSNLFPPAAPYTLLPTSSSLPATSSNWHDHSTAQELPDSWSQLLLGGFVGEEEKSGHHLSQLQQQQHHHHHQALNLELVKQENSANPYVYGHGNEDQFHHTPRPLPTTHWSSHMNNTTNNNPAAATSSPKSRPIPTTAFSSNMLDFSSKQPSDARNPLPVRSSEGNSGAAATTGGALKKARVQSSSSSNSAFKVRKEKLGDRITALHQLVSPFGKTDTASVLLEAIGYIRFLQSQIEALSLPYLGSGSGNMRHHHSVQGERNCIFPEDPGQLLNDNCMKRKATHEQDSHHEEGKDLRSRGLCLVPVGCTLQVGSDNGADYWAPAIGGGFR